MTDLQQFHEQLRQSMIEFTKSTIQSDGDDEDDENWESIQTLVNGLCDVVFKEFKTKIEQLSKESVPSTPTSKPKAKAKGKAATSNSPKEGTRKNPYITWVTIASQIRNGVLKGDEMVTVTQNFRDTSSSSAKSYFEYRDDLDIEGKELTIKELVSIIGTSLPNVKKVISQSAICWGLLPNDFREMIVSTYS